MTPQEQLCEKMRVEQSAYCLWLTAQPPEEILHHAYEYSVREDIIPDDCLSWWVSSSSLTPTNFPASASR